MTIFILRAAPAGRFGNFGFLRRGYRAWIALAETGLVPIGISCRAFAGLVQLCNLSGCETPTDGAQILPKLFLVARANDERRDGGTLEQPVQCDLRDGLAGFVGDVIDDIHDFEQIFVVNLWTDLAGGLMIEAADLRFGRAAPKFSREPAPAERAPNHRADALILAQGHQFPFIIAADQ